MCVSDILKGPFLCYGTPRFLCSLAVSSSAAGTWMCVSLGRAHLEPFGEFPGEMQLSQVEDLLLVLLFEECLTKFHRGWTSLNPH